MVVSRRRDPELDRLGTQKKDALARKQTIFADLQRAKQAITQAYEAMQSAWQERVTAKERMDREYAAMQREIEDNQATWDEYSRISQRNNERIDALRSEADREHQDMIDCFERASNAYKYGDKAEAPIYSREGYEHRQRRDDLNDEVVDLIRENKAAREVAKSKTSHIDKTAFHSARESFLQAKARHQSARDEFKHCKARRDRLQSEFEVAHAAHLKLKAEFQRRLEAVRSQSQRERDNVLEKAGIAPGERKDAKIVHKPDGTTQIYHGGLGRADGLGHGHVALDASGRKTYDRKAFAAHGGQNYVDSAQRGAFLPAVGTDFYDGKPAKVVKRRDGRTDIFFTDSGNYGDSVGHGHVVVDQDDQIRYYRDQWQDKKQGQYLIDDTKEDHTKI